MPFNPKDHMMNLKGKEYLQVAWRLVWFREDHPDWNISTELVQLDQQLQQAVFKTTICDANGEPKSSGYGSECVKDFHDYIEKAETKSVGRALAMLGYGTQFCADELDEGERIVDSPVPKKPKPAEKPKIATNEHRDWLVENCPKEHIDWFKERYGDNLEYLPDSVAVDAIKKLGGNP